MSYPARLLNDGETVVVSTRTHVKELFGPLLVLVAVLAAAVVLTGLVARETSGTAEQVLVGIVWVPAALVVLGWCVRPSVRWATTTYTFTDRRFIKRSGFLAKEGRTIPLNRISGVDFEIGVVDRLLGCGTLVVSDASEQGRVELHDIPRVEEVQLLVSEQLHRLSRGGHDRTDDGT